MDFQNPGALIYVPPGTDIETALARTTHLAVGAHPDDIELMALHGILAGTRSDQNRFTGVVVTDGSGSPRAGSYESFSDEQMREIRRQEQIEAAQIGQYNAVLMLDYTSAEVKDGNETRLVVELTGLLSRARPAILYTHNPADRHDTHVAVCLRVIAAVRALPAETRPTKIYGCEVWRDLDWLVDADKVILDTSGGEDLGAASLAAFATQIGGGKRYDLAVAGRRRANAAFHAFDVVDQSSAVTLAMDLTSLASDPGLDVRAFIAERLFRLSQDIEGRLARLS